MSLSRLQKRCGRGRRTGGKAAEVARVKITAAGRMALADEGCEIPVEMIGLCWLRDSPRRMTQIRWECPNRTLHDYYLP